MATGIAQMCWVLRGVREQLSPRHVTATLDRRQWESGDDDLPALLLWEALVTGPDKGQDHSGDARAAVEAFQRDTTVAGGVPEQSVPAMNVLAAAAMLAGLVIAAPELHTAGPIYTPQLGVRPARVPA
jgi:hypothetical protein